MSPNKLAAVQFPGILTAAKSKSVRHGGEKKMKYQANVCNTPTCLLPRQAWRICLMYSIYSLHTRCCTTASSIAEDTPSAGQDAINQPE
ncbi:hypothetical protein CHARACLAT_009977 [Characodon lateralis]|uniref:Uncharacterized protein n=1 Tax=Characodon lateralis TaxID=208331 RepID=A0ABU7DF72_9TELE|nr:hypothetical protein [Characodon lateralis]